MHEIHDLIQIVFSTTQECFADRGFALSAGAPSHLSQEGWAYEFATHSGIMKYDSSRRTGEEISQ